jgi:hypothetical protein
VAVQKFCVSADIQEGWRIVNLAEEMRIGGFIPSDEAVASLLGLGQFLRGGGHGLSRMDGLGDRCWKALTLKGGERGVEYGFGAAELTE